MVHRYNELPHNEVIGIEKNCLLPTYCKIYGKEAWYNETLLLLTYFAIPLVPRLLGLYSKSRDQSLKVKIIKL